MNLLVILSSVYIVFSYLYMIGYTVTSVGGTDNLGKVGNLIILTAPLSLPIALGAARSQD